MATIKKENPKGEFGVVFDNHHMTATLLRELIELAPATSKPRFSANSTHSSFS